MISIVIPTITGREESLQRARASYEASMPDGAEILVIKDEPSWPAACNEGYRRSTHDIIHFSADDLEAVPGWWEPAIDALETEDVLPAPRVYNYQYGDRFQDNVKDGPDGAFTHFTRVPIMRRDQWERVGEWPLMMYFADIWLSEKARTLGVRTRMVYGYDFIHHWSQIGRTDSQEMLDESGWALNRAREEMT